MSGPVSIIETTAGKLALVLYGSSNTIDLVPANARRNEAGKWVYSDRSGSYPVKEVKPAMRVLVRDDGVEGRVDDMEGGWAAERFGISGKIGVRDMKKVRSAFPDKTAALEDACWEGYEAVGLKDQDGKQVPNCVPKAASTLRERLIRLAHAHPEMRTHLLPLLQRD